MVLLPWAQGSHGRRGNVRGTRQRTDAAFEMRNSHRRVGFDGTCHGVAPVRALTLGEERQCVVKTLVGMKDPFPFMGRIPEISMGA